MITARRELEATLMSAGYRRRGESVFEAPVGRRVVFLFDVSALAASWEGRLDAELRHPFVKSVPTWARYAILTVESTKTLALAVAASVFARDVSKCRRIVVFSDQGSANSIPFLSLPATTTAEGTPQDDVERIVGEALNDPELANVFLDLSKSLAQVQYMAETEESKA